MTLLVGWWAVVGAVSVVRALPPFSGWATRGVKPWACDLCMSFWVSILFVLGEQLVNGWAHESWVLVPALTGLGIFTLSRLTVAPPGGPADFPPLVDSGEGTP